MKSTLFFLIFFIVVLTGCKVQYSQLYEAKSTFNKEGGLIFENDTVKISYFFWEDAGVLAFSIYNKLDIPLYVDWKKSSFVKQNDKFDYWIDEESSEHTSKYESITYSGVIKGWVNEGSSTTSIKTVKPERITFIAPHSQYKKCRFKLYNPSGTLIDTNHVIEYISSQTYKNKSVGIYNANYTPTHTPLTFRNFLTMSTTEKFDKEFYIDNQFYVSRITEMPTSELLGGDPKVIDNDVVYSFPYKAENRFYIFTIDNKNTIAERKKHHSKAYNLLYN